MSAENQRRRSTAGEGLTIRPEAGMWPLLPGHNTSGAARRFREQMGLPLDRPIVMTGHQAQFWHPGILAKYLAADAFAGSCASHRSEGAASANAPGPALAFLVVDQDRPTRASVRYPVIEPLGNLGIREVVYAREGPVYAQRDGASVPGFVREGLEAIDRAVQSHANEPTLARRIAFAVRDLMRPLLGPAGSSATVLFASDLCRTDLFAELVRRMAHEPERCIGAYNAAAARHVDAGVRPLEVNAVQDRWELPLWHLPPDGPRRHVYAEDIGRMPIHELAPKALCMTGLLRLAGCDLFIHGVGGGGDGESGYDQITDEWLHAWLGQEPSAPIAVVTATCHLPLGVFPPPTREEVVRAVWRAHHAAHHPGEVGLHALEQQRQAIVAEIAAATPHIRAELFHDLHAMLERYRLEHSAELDAARQAARTLRARQNDGAILADRTWAFPLYPPETVRQLRSQITDAFARA